MNILFFMCTYILKDASKNINLLALNLNYLGRSTKLMHEVKKQVESMYDKAFLKLDETKVFLNRNEESCSQVLIFTTGYIFS